MTRPGSTEAVRVRAAGDAALVAEFPSRIDPVVNDRTRALAGALRAQWSAILRDVVIGYCTVTVYFDPMRVDARWLESELGRLASPTDEAPAPPGALIRVPVCYDDDLGPDLHAVAEYGGCSPDEVVALHTGREYRVYMLGFVPGFAYMAEVDPRIAAPRRSTPRTAVAAGSVAIAGGQTGIYPSLTPGGWNLIGRTPVKPFDAARPEPFMFQSGDRVLFERMSRDEFDRVS